MRLRQGRYFQLRCQAYHRATEFPQPYLRIASQPLLAGRFVRLEKKPAEALGIPVEEQGRYRAGDTQEAAVR